MTTLEEAQAKIRAYFPKEPYALEFKRLSDYAIVCKCCGQFYVGKYSTREGEFFEVFFKPQGKPAQQLRTNLPTGTDAKSWASSLAAAYRKGTISLSGPLSPEEITRLRATA